MKIRLAGVALGAAMGGLAYAGDGFDFAPHSMQPVGSWAEAIAIGDVNGDRLDDVVLATTFYFDEANDYSVFVHLQRPDGTLAPPFKVRYAEFTNSADIELVDLDGDGPSEIVVGHGGGLTVYRWDGQASLQSRDFAAEFGCVAIASLDIDADGHADIACQSWGNDATLFFGDGLGGVRASTGLETGANGYNDMKAGDVSGDGLPDLVITSQQANQWFVHVNNGQGGFKPETAYPSPVTTWHFSAAAIADLNGDGRNDVAAVSGGNSPSSGLYVYHQNSAGTLGAPIRFSSYDIPEAMLAHDLDRDGRDDLLVGHSGWFAIGRYMQGANGLGAERLTAAPFNDGPAALAAGDFNDDGCTDAGIAEHNYGLVTLAGVGCNRPRTHGDFDGDGIADLLWHRDNGASVIWRSADSTTVKAVTRVNNLDWHIVATGDFDGDGRADIVWHNAVTGAGTIWRSGNSATQQALTRVIDVRWRIVAAGDFDGDGRDDLVWRHATDGRNAIWKGGNYRDPLAVPAVTGMDWHVAGAGDLDGDGRDDLVWRHATAGRNTAWKGADYRQNIAIAATGTGWDLAGIGDFDGDGHDDLFWRHGNGGNAIWRGGAYARPLAVSARSSSWVLAAVADYDGNGKDDVAWRNRVDGSNDIWRAAASTVVRGVTAVPEQHWQISP